MKLCNPVGIGHAILDTKQTSDIGFGAFVGVRPTGIKRMKLVCPVCKRKLLSSVSATEDGLVFHSIPAHKPKHWWKKHKK